MRYNMKIISRRKLPLRWGTVTLIAIMMIVSALFWHVPSSMASGRSIIPGHLIPAVKQLTPLQVSSSNRQLQLSIALNLRNSAGLDALIKAQNDPSSALYHQYLTPQQFTEMFSPTMASVNKVVSYLRSQGLQVSSISPNQTLIDASGSVTAVSRAFAISIADYHLDRRSVYAPTTEPSVPSDLAGLILNVGGLDNVAHYRPLAHQTPTLGPGDGYTPTELRTAYDMNSLISRANGGGQTVALFELDGYNPSDVNTYLRHYNLGAARYSNVLVDGATTSPGEGASEVVLDMEIVSAIAPGATQKIYIGPNSVTGVNDTYNRIVTDNRARVASTSWGSCEPDLGNSELSTLDNIFRQGAAQGQSIFAASGDTGAYDCLSGSGSNNLAVDSPADDPYVVGVGGTSLQLGNGGSYGSETGWNDTIFNIFGGGGGYSSFFSKPSYQRGPGVDSNRMRHVPDVSADADTLPGYSAYCTTVVAGCSSGSAGWTSYGGTSCAAPLWAGVATDTNSYLVSRGKGVLGNINSTLYRFFNTSQSFRAYHDVTTGNNNFYNAGPGYDLATGIGTPDAWNFARDAAGTS
ncbi:MAG: S8/S53 family peptidase [Ktedonobacteraceae bacterium]|nr:S8/S53 family peptidase [Ktedonobacteraceae bacterium]